MNLVPQVATAEISDAELDSVSGGQAGVGSAADAGIGVHAGAGALGAHAEVGNIGVTAGLGASVSPEGLSAAGALAVTQY
ncbi:hypothetical protein JL475_04425 [Streptomyces sp. M2CJ-2]|uniref:hypothetical protein n=1 Tax=Streptomyces sp. M2CJ-2 TaxID=2803948 RepID=UPI001920DB0C|nr:hypothetical protein [Streptomyces sp. M2CJ-2]MBL3665261.1 hypothetical protein [Streptomyces sp. M2CJ-2]